MIARQLAAQVVDEPGLVGLGRRQRERQDQVGDVVGTVLCDCEQEQGERRARVVVQAADQPEVEQRQTAVRRHEHVPVMRVGVIDALTVTCRMYARKNERASSAARAGSSDGCSSTLTPSMRSSTSTSA